MCSASHAIACGVARAARRRSPSRRRSAPTPTSTATTRSPSPHRSRSTSATRMIRAPATSTIWASRTSRTRRRSGAVGGTGSAEPARRVTPVVSKVATRAHGISTGAARRDRRRIRLDTSSPPSTARAPRSTTRPRRSPSASTTGCPRHEVRASMPGPSDVLRLHRDRARAARHGRQADRVGSCAMSASGARSARSGSRASRRFSACAAPVPSWPSARPHAVNYGARLRRAGSVAGRRRRRGTHGSAAHTGPGGARAPGCVARRRRTTARPAARCAGGTRRRSPARRSGSTR